MKSKTFLKFMFAIIAILIIGDFTSSCSSDEYEGLQLSFATRKKTRSGELGSDTSNKTWIAEAVENDIWTIEVCPNCTLDILYGWDRTEFLPEDRCKVNG